MKHRLKSNLDELQEQKLLHIEKKCFWLLYILLLAEIIVKLLIGKEPKAEMGEMICFLTVSVYMVFACIRNGIWDRYMKADRRTNLIASLIGAAAVFVVNGGIGWRFCGKLEIAALFGLISALLTFGITFVAMSVLSAVYRKRVKNLEETEDEDDD